MSSLFLVATPIGNLEDITLRALRVLGEVALVAAEDTRTTRKLLEHYQIKTPLTSFHQHSGKAKLQTLLQRLQQEDVALVTEAGTPLLSDPGAELVRAAMDRSILVVAIPGPSAVTTALAVSGLDVNQFVFLGFLPNRATQRRRLLESLKGEARTLIAFEAPHRLKDALKDLLNILGDRPVAFCRELTKIHEEVFRGSLSQALAHFEEPRGEFTLVIAGALTQAKATDGDAVKERLRLLRRQGLSAREAVGKVATEIGVSRREAYRLWLSMGP